MMTQKLTTKDAEAEEAEDDDGTEADVAEDDDGRWS